MNTGQCRRLLAAYRYAQSRPVKVIVLGGPRDFFSDGIHLNAIQVADDPAEESWRNINAMNDLVEAILTTTRQLTLAALAGNAAAGGLMLALAANQVWCRDAAVLNPHYKLMGLHGSKYGPTPCPAASARRRRHGPQRLPAGRFRLRPAIRPGQPGHRRGHSQLPRAGGGHARRLAAESSYPAQLADAKARQLTAAEKQRPLAAYRAAELAIMSRNFSGPHRAICRSCTGRSSTRKSHCAHRLTWPGTGLVRGPPAPAKVRAPQMVRVAAS